MKDKGREDWKSICPEEPPVDPRLVYIPAEKLEPLQNRTTRESSHAGYGTLKQYRYLRKQQIQLESLPLTDKQLIALSLVFYGGIQKKRAARAMNISSQALDDHIKAGLKKVRESFLK